MSEPADARRELIVAYLLGELDQTAAADLERRLDTDPALRSELESLRPVVSELEQLPRSAWETVEPPPLSLGDAADESARTAPAGARPRKARSGWTRPQIAFAGVAAAAALAAGVVIGVVLDGDDSQPDSTGSSVPIALQPIGSDAPGARGELTVGPGDRADLEVSDLPANDRDYYEIWLLGDDGLVSLGSFRVTGDGTADVQLTLPVDPGAYNSFDVSREPEDGDPAHSGDSILRGPT